MKIATMDKPALDGSNSNNNDFMRGLLAVLGELGNGDFSARLPSDWTGLEGRVADRVNEIANRMENFNKNLLRLRYQVGEEGKIGERLHLGDSAGKVKKKSGPPAGRGSCPQFPP